MKLYTEKQLLEICHSVAEKVISTSLSKDRIEQLVDYYGGSSSKLELDDQFKMVIEKYQGDDDIAEINVEVTTVNVNIPKKKFPCNIVLGNYIVTEMSAYEDCIWIQNIKSSEGGQFHKDKLIPIIDEFFKENF